MMSELERVTYEEALKKSGFGRFNILMVLLCSSVITGMVFELSSVGYLVPASSCELMTTSEQQGWMAATPLIGITATSYFWGYLADTQGRKKVLFYSMLLVCVSSTVASLAPNWLFFIAFKFLSSSFISGSFAVSLTLLSETTPEDKRFIFMVFTSTVFFFGNGLMALITIPVLPLTFSYHIPGLDIHFNSWRLLSLIFVAPSVVAFVGLIFTCESPKFLMSIGRDEEALETVKNMYTLNNNKSGDDFPVKSMTLDEDRNVAPKGFWSSIWHQTVPIFKPPLLKNTLLISPLFITVYFCLVPFRSWLPYINDLVMASVDRGEKDMTFCERVISSQNFTSTVEKVNDCSLNKFAMMLVFTFSTFLALLNCVITVAVKYIGRRALFIIIQLVSGMAALLVNVSNDWVVGSVFFIIYLLGVLNFGFLFTFSVEAFPTYVKAMSVCLTLMAGRGSAFVGVYLLKQILQTSCDEAFYVCGGLTIAGSILGFFIPVANKPGQKKCEET